MTSDHINSQIANAAGVPDGGARRPPETVESAQAMPAGGSHNRRAHSRREAEVEEIVAALRPYGVLRRAQLAGLCRARHWTGPGFRPALARAVSSGRVKSLGCDLYEITDSSRDSGAHPSLSRAGRTREP